jgi:hypothetical protein
LKQFNVTQKIVKSSQKYGLGIQDPEKSYPLSWIRDLRSETLLNGENILTILTIFKSVLLVLSSEDPVNFDNVLVVQLERLQDTKQLCQVALWERPGVPLLQESDHILKFAILYIIAACEHFKYIEKKSV